ncbi:MAG: UDP-N-acetylglucosamine 2-epimerase (non-hydrolyzing) [Burkholderiales bacterium]|nr:UDP-N-acetylglucosamine 2-epimerase (non-hydrolyzing) [Burkholderiales bacterium]
MLEVPIASPTATARSPRARRHDVLIVAGTRPECIKLAPVVRELGERRRLSVLVVNSGQHAEAVRRSFGEFGVTCDVELPQHPCAANLAAASRRLTHALTRVVAEFRPALVLVQGDTLTAYAGTRAAVRAGRPVGHVEAGLRAPSASDPFPEEWFRRRIARHARIHFAPCDSAYRNLVAEGTPPARIRQVGNTGIDSLRALLAANPSVLSGAAGREILVTLHRRENWDSRADDICDALLDLARARPDLRVRLPVHPNPRIAPRLRKRLAGHAQFTLAAPLAYGEFIAAVARAPLVISDSGGIQEEVPHLGVPLLVPRSCTERPEGVATGFVRIVPASRDDVVREALSMLAAPRRAPLPFDRNAPFGDGTAAAKIAGVLEASLRESAAA